MLGIYRTILFIGTYNLVGWTNINQVISQMNMYLTIVVKCCKEWIEGQHGQIEEPNIKSIHNIFSNLCP